MKFTNKFLGMSLLSLAIILIGSSAAKAQDSEFSLKVINRTEVTFKKLLVSVDGKRWGFFDVGAGIASGKSADLVWSKTTDTEPCKQCVKPSMQTNPNRYRSKSISAKKISNLNLQIRLSSTLITSNGQVATASCPFFFVYMRDRCNDWLVRRIYTANQKLRGL